MILSAVTGALVDTAWAIWLTPFSHRRPPKGIWPKRLALLAVLKLSMGGVVLWQSLRTRLAKRVHLRHLPGEGFFANYLHVLEVLERVRPDAQVHVDWTVRGDEYYFRYGAPGTNVWEQLFAPLAPAVSAPCWRPDELLCVTFWGHAKEYLQGEARLRQRRRYHAVLTERISVTSPRVRAAVDELTEGPMAGRYVVGVHRRVGNPMVAALQQSGVAPDLGRLIARVRAQLEGHPPERSAVYLATDDEDAVAGFRASFGAGLIVRDGVKRTIATGPEVHAAPSGPLSITDAEDVLIDALVLARCDVFVHASSSVSTAVSIINAELEMVSL